MFKEFWLQVNPVDYKEDVVAKLVVNDINGNRINVALIEDGSPVDLTDATHATFTIKKPDTTTIIGNAEFDDSVNGKIRFVMPGGGIADIGIYELTIEIYDGVSRITAGKLIYQVVNELDTSDGIVAEDNYPVLLGLINDVSTSIQSIEGATDGEEERVAAELLRVDAELARVIAEGERVTAETSRTDAESARVTVEGERVTAETTRSDAESSRVLAESARETAEGLRNDAETTRIFNAGVMVDNETDRIAAETTRSDSETARVTAESNRALAETARVDAESARVTAESNRVTAETGRVDAELVRAAAEIAREQFKSMGEYDGATQYQALNMVTYNGSSYMANKSSLGVLPTNIVNWTILASKGVDGEGSVASVNTKTPDAEGNVSINASEVPVDGTAAGDETLVDVQAVAAKVVTILSDAQTYTDSAIAALLDSSPAALDTLNELAAALGNDPNFATTVTNQIAGKADAVHTHIISEITGLQTALDAKAASSHTHAISEVTNLQTSLDAKKALSDYLSGTGASIPTSGWVEATDTDYALKVNVALTGVTASHRPWYFIGPDAVALAQAANLSRIVESYAGGFTFYCDVAPTAAITFEWEAIL